jgi:hypothetical protein
MEIFANLVGVTFRPAEAKTIVKALTPADGSQLRLETEPDNQYDGNAVKVIHTPTDTHLGYLARENNYDVFQALEHGEELVVEIVGFENTLKPTLLITDAVEDTPLTAEDMGEFPGEL